MAVKISTNFNRTAYCLYKHRGKNEAADFMMGAILRKLVSSARICSAQEDYLFAFYSTEEKKPLPVPK